MVNELWGEGVPKRQHKAIIAQRLGVSLRTVYNDFATLTAPSADHRCPLCGARIRLEKAPNG